MSVYGTTQFKFNRINETGSFDSNTARTNGEKTAVETIDLTINKVYNKKTKANLNNYTFESQTIYCEAEYNIHKITENEKSFFRNINYEIVEFFPYADNTLLKCNCIIICEILPYDNKNFFDSVNIKFIGVDDNSFSDYFSRKLWIGSYQFPTTANPETTGYTWLSNSVEE